MKFNSKNSFQSLDTLTSSGKDFKYFNLKTAEKNGLEGISQLPKSLKVLLENLLRYEDDVTVDKKQILALKDWLKNKKSNTEIAYRPARTLLQDYTGIPAIADLAAMRDAVKEKNYEIAADIFEELASMGDIDAQFNLAILTRNGLGRAQNYSDALYWTWLSFTGRLEKSEKVLEKLDDFLGRPRFDPHGDPIPSKGGVIQRIASKPLSDFAVKEEVRIESIIDQDKKFLKFARKAKLVPGQVFMIVGKEDCADAITLKTAKGQSVNLGFRSAEKVLALPIEA